MYPTLKGENKHFNRFYLRTPLVEKQYPKYQMPAYYWANKSGYSFVQLNILLLCKIFALINEFIYNCRFRISSQGTIYYLFFTSFSGHRPAQRECARTRLWSHARCHPFSIPQPVKVGHTTGVCDPYSFRIVTWVLLRPTRTNQWKCAETGPSVFWSLSEKTRKSNHLQTSLERQHFLLSYLKTLSVCSARVWTATSLSTDPRSPSWANQAAVSFQVSFRLPLSFLMLSLKKLALASLIIAVTSFLAFL